MIDLESFKSGYAWRCAFHQAFLGSYGSEKDGPIKDVVEVIAAAEGENDGPNWLAVVRMADGRFAKVFAGCDYTGWD